MTMARNTLICTGCFQEKPRAEFNTRARDTITGDHKIRQPCRECCAEQWKSWTTEKRAEAHHAQQVQLNRLINSLPVPQL